MNFPRDKKKNPRVLLDDQKKYQYLPIVFLVRLAGMQLSLRKLRVLFDKWHENAIIFEEGQPTPDRATVL